MHRCHIAILVMYRGEGMAAGMVDIVNYHVISSHDYISSLLMLTLTCIEIALDHSQLMTKRYEA